MAKHKITVKDKEAIRDLIIKNIEKQYPEFDYITYIKEEKEKIETYLNDWVKHCWKQSEEVQKFLNQFELYEFNSYGHHYINTTHDTIDTSNYFCLNVYTIFGLRNKKPLILPEKYENLIISSNDCITFQNIIFKIAKEEYDRISLEIRKKEKEFMKIYSNFKNILFSCKYLEDVGEMIPLPEVVEYIENKLLSQCTLLAPINKESINFVDNYIKTLKNN